MSKDKEEIKNSGNIIDDDISKQMSASYLDYAMSVITSRALPDIRDGLKPVHRRILFAMHGMGLSVSAKTRKSAAIVGEVLGKYHPHGNMAVYDAMVKLSQDFGTRYPLVIGQGNFGSVDGDSPAAERYTEAKLSKIAEEMLKDIEKNTVEFQPNYENTMKEPTVLPALPPNLLLNGSLGIAVGMATNIPPHNLNEICDAIIYAVKNKEATSEDLMKFVTGPDFPLGGNAYDKKAIAHAYATGKGGVVVRGDVDIEEGKKNSSIVITSIPYRVNKSDLVSKIGTLVREKKIEGVKDLRDESTKDIRIVIDLKASAQANRIKNTLFKNTQLEETFHYNMVGLQDGIPKTFSISDLILTYIEHRIDIVIKRTKYRLEKAKEREHILLGLKIALDNIDEIVNLIKKSKSVQDAREKLIKKYKLSEIQSNAILDMRLQKLSGLEREKIQNELKEIQKLIKELELLLKDKKKIDEEVIKEQEHLKKSYGDNRRTKIYATHPGSISEEDLIPEEQVVLAISEGGYIKRTSPKEYKSQKRGGVGTKGGELKTEDVTTISLSASTHDTLFFFTDRGKVYKIKTYDLPEGKKSTKGRALVNFIDIEQDERVTSLVPIQDTKDTDQSVCFVTKSGTVKRVKIKDFENIRKTGIIAVNLIGKDKLVSTFIAKDKDEVFIITKKGKAIRFKSSEIRTMGRSAKGVKGIKLGKDDEVVSSFLLPKDLKEANVLTITSHGFGKKTKASSFKVQKRGGSGIKVAELNSKTGDIVGSHLIEDNDEGSIVTISKKGQVVRQVTKDIPMRMRQTQGVKVMKLKDNDTITSITHL